MPYSLHRADPIAGDGFYLMTPPAHALDLVNWLSLAIPALIDEDAYDIRGACGFTFGNGCSTGSNEVDLFGAKKRAKTPMAVA